MFKLGLTGSIGMGKSTTARMFAAAGCAVWDADAAVHRIYSKGGSAVVPIAAQFPDAVVSGTVSRDYLKELIAQDASVLKTLESIVHPLVAQDRAAFIENTTSEILVFDIPLLFETGGDQAMDAVACVSVSPEEQEKRVMARGTMSKEQFLTIRNKQMPNEEKCARADYVIATDTLEHAQAQVHSVIKDIRGRLNHA